jgi:ribosomal protein S18 acetylase RimI-like enzyme
MDAVVNLLKEDPELRLIRAVVTVTSEAALSLLEKQGFQVYGQEPKAKRLDDKFFDQVYVWLPLR